VDTDNIGVIELGRSSSFAQKLLRFVSILGTFARCLDRDVSVELGILGTPHSAEGPCAKLLNKFEATDPVFSPQCATACPVGAGFIPNQRERAAARLADDIYQSCIIQDINRALTVGTTNMKCLHESRCLFRLRFGDRDGFESTRTLERRKYVFTITGKSFQTLLDGEFLTSRSSEFDLRGNQFLQQSGT
jgi:hypothetical protein